jgi:hypothetical protein
VYSVNNSNRPIIFWKKKMILNDRRCLIYIEKELWTQKWQHSYILITYSSRSFEKQCYMNCVFNGMIINKLTHANYKWHCLKIQHCLIIKHFITHNTLKHCSKACMIWNNVWLCLYIYFRVSDFITVHVVNINWIKTSTQSIHIWYNTFYSS